MLIARKLAWSSFHTCAIATTVAVADDIIPAGTELKRVAKAPIAANVAAMTRIKRPRHWTDWQRVPMLHTQPIGFLYWGERF